MDAASGLAKVRFRVRVRLRVRVRVRVRVSNPNPNPNPSPTLTKDDSVPSVVQYLTSATLTTTIIVYTPTNVGSGLML